MGQSYDMTRLMTPNLKLLSLLAALFTRFFPNVVTANGMKVSNPNGVYAHKPFIETEYSNCRA